MLTIHSVARDDAIYGFDGDGYGGESFKNVSGHATRLPIHDDVGAVLVALRATTETRDKPFGYRASGVIYCGAGVFLNKLN